MCIHLFLSLCVCLSSVCVCVCVYVCVCVCVSICVCVDVFVHGCVSQIACSYTVCLFVSPSKKCWISTHPTIVVGEFPALVLAVTIHCCVHLGYITLLQCLHMSAILNLNTWYSLLSSCSFVPRCCEVERDLGGSHHTNKTILLAWCFGVSLRTWGSSCTTEGVR